MVKSYLVLASYLAVGLCAPSVQNHETVNVRISRTLFSCKDGFNTIEPVQVCDGITHCKDLSDEDPIMCKTWECDSSVPFKCNHSSKCIPNSRICDKRADCKDGSDENPSLCSKSDQQDSKLENGLSRWSGDLRFYCEDGKGSIHWSQVCDEAFDCLDKSDENPKLCKNRICPPDFSFLCGNNSCLANELVCNGHRDCLERDDEDSILCDHNNVLEFATEDKSLEGMFSNLGTKLNRLPPFPFTCENEIEGVALNQVCDGRRDCRDRSDEDPEMCKTWQCAPEIPFKCKTRGLCLPKRSICDMKNDCPDGSDEDVYLCGVPEEVISPPDIATIEITSSEEY